VDFNQSYFEILQLPVGFSVDQDVLTNHYREVQKSVHPDRFAGGSDREKRLAVQWATRVNEAYEVLKSPLKRAIYLLEMVEVELSDNPQLDSGFLIEQIDLRERLEEIEHESDALAKLDLFKKEVTQVVAELQSECVTAYEAQNYPAATQVVYKVQFMNKLHVAAEHLEEKLLDY